MNIDRLRDRINEIHAEEASLEDRKEAFKQEALDQLEQVFLCIPECRRKLFAESLKSWEWGIGTYFGSSNRVFADYIMDVRHKWTPAPIPLAIIDASIEYPFLKLCNRCRSCGILVPSASGYVLDGERTGFWQTTVFPFWPCPVCGGELGNRLGQPIDWTLRTRHKLPPDPPLHFVTELPERLRRPGM